MSRNILKVGLLTIFLLISFWIGCNQEKTSDDAIIKKPKLSEMIENFNLNSYYAGATFAASEFVSAGCKKLALSAAYTDEEFAVMMEPTKLATTQYNLPFYVEKDFLTTPLFSSDLTKNKTVIFIAQNQKVLDDYFALKKLKQQAIDEGRLQEVEIEIAWEFGKLLSYSDEYITQLISEHTN
ncbi:hypothetical protein ACFLQZ_00410 [Acidobacteriota bacterium]